MVPDLKEIINKMIDNAKGKTFLKSNTDVTSQEVFFFFFFFFLFFGQNKMN